MALDRELTLMISLFKLKGESKLAQSDAAGELSNNKIHTDRQGHTSIRQLIAAKFRAVRYKRLIINSSSVLWVMNLIEHVATPERHRIYSIIPTRATLLLMALRKY
jgi:hypothetical protein